MKSKISLLREICRQRANLDQERLERELQEIDKYDLVETFYELYQRGITGSQNMVNSLVAYALGLTSARPQGNFQPHVRYKSARVSMPDIDIDFADDRRDEMIEYATQKYGQDHVAQIITFGTMAARAAIRDAGRVLGLPLSDVDRMAKLIPFGVTIKQAWESVQELQELAQEKEYIENLVETAQGLEGVARHASTHAAGVVISRDPLTEHVPLQKAIKGEGIITQYHMGAVEKIGLLKMDFLGLSTLTVIGRALDLIRETQGVEMSPPEIPLDDPAIYELLSTGEVTGVFQVESAGMRRVLRDFQPHSFADVTAILALYRPGPMRYIDDFIKRKHGQVSIEYLHPSLEPILKETYGIIVFQEQILEIAKRLAGFSGGQADLLRRAVGKKKAEELKRQRESFIEGAVRNGIPRKTAEQVFAMVEYFARYGFPKAHSAAYAVITCQTAYLKAKYPVEYMAALLSVERNNTDKVAALVSECYRLDIPVLPPDINRSHLDFVVDDGAIRFGLGAVKNVGEGPIEAILEARGQQPFQTIDDFCRRVDLRQVNRRALESLIQCGTFDAFGRRAQLLAVIDRMIGLSQRAHYAQEIGQMSMFDTGTGLAVDQSGSLFHPLPDLPEVSRKERLAWEKELLGLYVSEHPLRQIAGRLGKTVTTFCGQIDPQMKGQKVIIAGLVTGVRSIITRKGDPMAFAQLEDLQGSIEVVVFPSVYDKTRPLWQEDNLLVIKGKVDVRDGRPQVICQSARPYAEEADESSVSSADSALSFHLHITVPRTGDQEQDIKRLGEVYGLLQSYEGDDRFSLYIANAGGRVQLDFPNTTTRYCAKLERALIEMLGAGTVRVESK